MSAQRQSIGDGNRKYRPCFNRSIHQLSRWSAGQRIACMGVFSVLFESMIRFPARNGFPGFLKPSGPYLASRIEFGDIRLDVQKWGPVKHVHVFDVKHTRFNSVKTDYRKSDRIGAPRRTRGKEPSCLRIHEGNDVKAESLRTMKMVQQENMGEAVEILQAYPVRFEHLDGTPNVGSPGRLNRHTFDLFEGAVNHPDGLILDFHLFFRMRKKSVLRLLSLIPVRRVTIFNTLSSIHL